MDIRFVDNQQVKLSGLLTPEIQASLDTRIAVAFVSDSGLKLVQDAVLQALSFGAQIEMLVGLDFTTTEAKALWKLHQWKQENSGFNFYCLPIGWNTYHPKMYLMAGSEHGVVCVGSSNLTAGGLSRNAEANILIRSSKDSEVFTDAQSSYVRLKFDGRRIPDENFLAAYEESTKKKKSVEKSQPKELQTLFTTLETDFETLPKPSLTSKDLVGWLKLVYETLPEGEFTNEDVYGNKDYYRSQYPDNQNIRAKVRQQLQGLRDMGLVEHVSSGVWRKA